MALQTYFTDTFDPQPGETALVITDLPAMRMHDTPSWRERRTLAARWRDMLAQIGSQRRFRVLPLAYFLAPPTQATAVMLGDEDRRLDELLPRCTLVIALCEQLVEATLETWARRYPNLRVALFPQADMALEGLLSQTDQTVLEESCAGMCELLNAAHVAQVTFSNNDLLTLDLRFRAATADQRVQRPTSAQRVAVLPGGTVRIACYEGEQPAQPSITRGVLPITWHGELLRLELAGNRVVDVLGRGEGADNLRMTLSVDGARHNLAGLKLGCRAIAGLGAYLGSPLFGSPTLILGRSDQLGGTVDAARFGDPAHVWHTELRYSPDRLISISRITLTGPTIGAMPIYASGEYASV
jgi:hypothetical protein